MKILQTIGVIVVFLIFMQMNLMGAAKDLTRPKPGESDEAVTRRVTIQTIAFGLAGLGIAIFLLYRIWR